MWFYAAWAFVVITLTWGRKGVRKMMNSEQYREHIERTFNAFCKIVLYHAALGAYKKLRKKQQFEVSLDYLREFDFERHNRRMFREIRCAYHFYHLRENGHCGK